MEIQEEFIALGCNNVPGCLTNGSIKNPELIAYAGNCFIGIFNTENTKLLRTLRGHQSRINTLKWISCHENKLLNDNIEYIISGSSDGELILWNTSSWEIVATLNRPNTSVTTVTGFHYPFQINDKDNILIVAAYTDGFIKVFNVNNIFEEIECIEMGWNHIIKCLSLTKCSSLNSTLILSAGGVDCKIYFYTLSYNINEKKINFLPLTFLLYHKDWLYSMDWIDSGNGIQYLACSSLDQKISLWKLSPTLSHDNKFEHDNTKKKRVLIQNKNYQIELDALLIGHEDWITCIEWKKNNTNELELLSCSMDNTMILWSLKNDFWSPLIHLGNENENNGGQGIGWRSCCYGNNHELIKSNIYGINYHGSFCCWEYNPISGRYINNRCISGHTNKVTDITWNEYGEYFLSVSKDETTRMFCLWKKNEKKTLSWHEISRPQIHGYGINCISNLPHFYNKDDNKNKNDISFAFVSGADEKILRVFEAPNVVKNLFFYLVKKKEIHPKEKSNYISVILPQLSLTNKQVTINEEKMIQMDCSQPPLEDDLINNTLWPEKNKLYGHGNEIYSIACHPHGNILVSSCKSRDKEFAKIRIWETTFWTCINELSVHNSTITQLKFSFDGKYLLSVSKDRSFAIFQYDKILNKLILILHKLHAHKRIIWCGDFHSNSKCFATGSRDQSIKIWNINENQIELIQELICSSAVISLSFLPQCSHEILAIGCENGTIGLYERKKKEVMYKLTKQIQVHVGMVKKITWCPISKDKNSFRLLSCGEDHSIRLFHVEIHNP